MGRRGPPPMPTRLKVLHGERRKSRINRAEPKPAAKLLRMPAGMRGTAAMVWRRVIRDFGPTGVLTTVDADALRIYCEAIARYTAAQQQLEEEGPVVAGARGGMVKNPLHQVVRDNADLARAFARELGLTPSARTGLRVPGKDEETDPLTAWEKGTGS